MPNLQELLDLGEGEGLGDRGLLGGLGVKEGLEFGELLEVGGVELLWGGVEGV